MNRKQHNVENITSIDVDFRRVESKFDQITRRSLMDGTSL